MFIATLRIINSLVRLKEQNQHKTACRVRGFNEAILRVSNSQPLVIIINE